MQHRNQLLRAYGWADPGLVHVAATALAGERPIECAKHDRHEEEASH